MADKEKTTGQDGGSNATAVRPKRTRKPAKNPPKHLPPWKVLLHNDDKNEITFVIRTVAELTPQRTIEAHEKGVSLLLVTHKERAELYQEQFQTKKLVVTIEPDEKG
jgi:ATP-dependent Clp protease adaptor protein ClpS